MRVPIIMAIVLCLISVLTDVYIWQVIRGNTGNGKRQRGSGSTEYYARINTRKKWAVFYAILSILLWGVLAAVIFLPKREANNSILPLMWVMYSYITIYASKLIFCLFSLVGKCFGYLTRRNKIRSHQCRSVFNFIGVILAVACFGILWYGSLFTRKEMTVVPVNLEFSSLPKSFDGYKIVQISDLHLGTWGSDTIFVSNLVNKINASHPDLILFTGDIVNRETKEMKPFMSVLSRLKGKDGVYSVLGNHDYGDYIDWDSADSKKANVELMKQWQKQMGWRLLNNDHEIIRRGVDEIVLIGVENWGEPPFKQYGRLGEAYPLSKKSAKNLNDNRFKILLSHNPKHWHEVVRKISNIDLTLSGHTHAMQMMMNIGDVKWSPAALRYEEWGGLYEYGPVAHPRRLYVNIGAGEVGMPFRVGAVPEITEITLHKK